MRPTENRLRIGQVAAAVGVSNDTLRYYERIGLLPKPGRTASGYRVYGRSILDRVEFIRKAQCMGFNLDQIKSILSERDRGNAPCESVVAMTRQRLSEVESELKQLRTTRRSLKRYLSEWNDEAANCAAEEFCSLITRSET